MTTYLTLTEKNQIFFIIRSSTMIYEYYTKFRDPELKNKQLYNIKITTLTSKHGMKHPMI